MKGSGLNNDIFLSLSPADGVGGAARRPYLSASISPSPLADFRRSDNGFSDQRIADDLTKAEFGLKSLALVVLPDWQHGQEDAPAEVVR